MESPKSKCHNGEVFALRRYDDIIDENAVAYSEDLDMEDLALIESIVRTIGDEDEDQGKSMKWELEEMIDDV